MNHTKIQMTNDGVTVQSVGDVLYGSNEEEFLIIRDIEPGKTDEITVHAKYFGNESMEIHYEKRDLDGTSDT